MSTLGIVIPCYRQERWLPRTLDALRTLPSGFRPSGALVYAGGGAPAQPLVPGPPGWRVVTPPAERRDAAPLTPGAARMAGLAACEGEWVLFADADVEVDALWLARALARIESGADARLAGLWGRIEEWFVDANGRESAGVPDLYGVGEAEHEVDYLATLALYRRAALLEAGGYDSRLSSEEDFELGLRLRARGFRLLSLAGRAARHWSAPRPSFSELSRRWSTGLCFGQGQVLRIYLGRPGFGRLIARQSLYLATLALWLAGAAALAVSAARRSPAPLLSWLALGGAALAAMAVRKRSVRLAAHSALTWTMNGLGLLVGWFRVDPRTGREAAC